MSEVVVASDLLVLTCSFRDGLVARSALAFEEKESLESLLSIFEDQGSWEVGDEDFFSGGDGSGGDEIWEKGGRGW